MVRQERKQEMETKGEREKKGERVDATFAKWTSLFTRPLVDA